MSLVITIDGPAGSGKSTVARKLANRLGFLHLNSGALYRAVALKALDLGIVLQDEEAVASVAAQTSFTFALSFEAQRSAAAGNNRSGTSEASAATRLLVDGYDMSERIGGEAAGEGASQVAVYPRVRDILFSVQRNAAAGRSVVVEGRDAGTVVFPGASLKVYLDADLEIRVDRRFRESSSDTRTLEQVREEMRRRDHRDTTRAVAPQRRADDAVILDTSAVTADEAVERIISLLPAAPSRGSRAPLL